MVSDEDLFESIGLTHETAKQVASKRKVSSALREVIDEAGVTSGCTKGVGSLLYTISTKHPPAALSARPLLARMVADGRVSRSVQLEAALLWLKTLGAADVTESALADAAGVGVVVSPDIIKRGVQAALAQYHDELMEERYQFPMMKLRPAAISFESKLRFADNKDFKDELDNAVSALLGPKGDQDFKKSDKKKRVQGIESRGALSLDILTDPFSIFSSPNQNNQVHTEIRMSWGDVLRPLNSSSQLERHIDEVTRLMSSFGAPGPDLGDFPGFGNVVTRFPPEPNGYLHIGHAKAMYINFGFARSRGGICYLRFDDTNPSAERQEYIDHIQDIVHWLGWEPCSVTYSSDHFHRLYEFAVKLIKAGYAYVCHQSSAQIAEERELRRESPWRNRPIWENLQIFEDMRRGKIGEGDATLRMKMDVKNDNYNMFDLIAYRIKFEPHPRTGAEWCIYPSYDYTHCIIDSIENITHSLCTLEFETRRASYFWLLDKLELYKSIVWEYGRLNISNNVLSKRKLNILATKNYVFGWDDPRLLTLAGLRRRGYSASAINSFCKSLGITRNDTLIPYDRLENYARADLEGRAERTMCVQDPLRVVISNLPEHELHVLSCPKHPLNSDMGTSEIPFCRIVYIEHSDFREKDSKNYYGLAPGKQVLLRHAYPITCDSYELGSDGRPSELQCTFDPERLTKPKGVIHWVAAEKCGTAPGTVTLRLYDKLFNSEEPSGLEHFTDDLNPNSFVEKNGVLAMPALLRAKAGDVFQFERIGYFCVDPDSSGARGLILNRTCSLRESSEKRKT